VKVTFTGAEVPTPSHALALVVVTVILEPLAVSEIDCVVSPVDQRYESADEEVSVTVSPVHAVVADAFIVGTGALLTSTVIDADVEEQPLPSV
jgi:hypothetical protein